MNGPVRAGVAAAVAAVAFLGVGAAVMALDNGDQQAPPTSTTQEVRPVADTDTTTLPPVTEAPTTGAPDTIPPVVEQPAPEAPAPEPAPVDPGPGKYTTPNGPEGPPLSPPPAPVRSPEEGGGATSPGTYPLTVGPAGTRAVRDRRSPRSVGPACVVPPPPRG